MSEPTTEIFHKTTWANRLYTWLAAARPAFLTASILPVLVAAAMVWARGNGFAFELAVLAVVNIALIHSGANVLNDYFDALNGTDAQNTGRIFPFTGGSRFIQNEVLTLRETRNLGFALMGAGIGLGLVMALMTGPWLLLIGAVGVGIAVFYSAPPCLACRGLGDLAIAVCFGLLPVLGTSLVLTGGILSEAWWVGTIIGCFVAAILWINSIPDIAADRKAGKWTLPARLGPERARYGLVVLYGLGFGVLLLSPLPLATWLALLAVVPAALSVRSLWQGQLIPAIPQTLLTHAFLCVLLVVGYVVHGSFFL